MTIRLRFDGRVFIPEQPVDLPEGAILELPVPFAPGESAPPQGEPIGPQAEPVPPLLGLLKIAESYPNNPDWPEDSAAQVDHYLYGHPKRP